MSYDFYLLPKGRVDEFLARFEEQTADDDLEINPGPIVPEREAWKARVSAAMISAEPRFEPFPFGFAEIAKEFAISEPEARVRYRHIELNPPQEDGTGIQVTIYDDQASLTVAYWHTGPAAHFVFEQIGSYLRVLESAGELSTFDAQLGRVIDLDLPSDFEEVLARYLRISTRLPEIIAQGEGAKKKKPWWKFW